MAQSSSVADFKALNGWNPARFIGSIRQGPSPLLDLMTVLLVAIIFLMALIGPLLAPDVEHSGISSSLLPPGPGHWLGTDEQGRDVLWRIVAGSRTTLSAAVEIVAGYALVGVLVATLAAAGPRWLGEFLMRLADLGLSFPSLVFALGISATLGASMESAITACICTGWPMTARLLGGIMREVKQAQFVEGARVLGVSRTRLFLRHILPNALPVLWVKWAGDIGNTVLVVGGLSFIGAGAQPPSPEWGAMINDARGLVSTAWWAAFFPGLAIAITTAAFGLLGDMLHHRLNPELRSKTGGLR
ncbi:ABC transporter permease [Arthrobacter bambusae]|uniref:ABC transporter permease n=1 Tax=Arthrobacter bambusae TaxID=1338426 RepID=UPI00278A1B74|nr:ABC transporter permease [Arthrobacter bambusae]MDQ0239531.1 peptide/nickel transport system permease protein [Arthrobacter bambusae]